MPSRKSGAGARRRPARRGRRPPASSPGGRPPGGRRRREDLHVRAVLGDPRRADEDRPQRPSVDPATSRSASKLRIWRPKALRSARMSIRPRWSRSSMISPAQEPSTGSPRAGELPQRLRPAPRARSPSVIVVDSPPGSQPVEARRGRPARAPRDARAPSPLQHPLVRLEAALQREHADQRCVRHGRARSDYQPRWARSCSSSSLELSRLTIAGPEAAGGRARPARGPASGWWPRRSRAPARAGPRT